MVRILLLPNGHSQKNWCKWPTHSKLMQMASNVVHFSKKPTHSNFYKGGASIVVIGHLRAKRITNLEFREILLSTNPPWSMDSLIDCSNGPISIWPFSITRMGQLPAFSKTMMHPRGLESQPKGLKEKGFTTKPLYQRISLSIYSSILSNLAMIYIVVHQFFWMRPTSPPYAFPIQSSCESLIDFFNHRWSRSTI